MTINESKQTFLFDFIKSEMILRNTTELTQDLINTAYRNTISFLSNEDVLDKIKVCVKSKIK